MAESFERSLRRAMEALGHLVEALIGRAQKARVQVGSRGGVQPILSLESQLDPRRLRELIDESVQRVITDSVPDIRGGLALEVGEGPARFGPHLLSSQARLAVSAEIGGGSTGRQGDISRGYVIRAKIDRLPFNAEQFTYVLARLATTLQGDMVSTVRELGRILAPGGQGLLIDFHPYGLYAKRGSGRLRPIDSGLRCFEDYYRLCQKSGIRVVNVREAFIDEGIRGFFREEEIQAYRNLKGSPLLAFLFVYKPKGKG